MKFLLVVILFAVFTCQAVAQNWFVARYFANGTPDGKHFADTLNAMLASAREKPAPDVVFKRIDNNRIDSLSAHFGKTILLNCWQTTCPPCIKEMPDFERARVEFSKKDFELLFISNIPSEDQAAFFKKNQNLVDGIKTTMDDQDFRSPFQCMVMPTSFIIDKKGVIRDSWLGALPFDSLKAKIQTVLFSTN